MFFFGVVAAGTRGVVSWELVCRCGLYVSNLFRFFRLYRHGTRPCADDGGSAFRCNFNSPYKALNVIDFGAGGIWRCRALRDYVYIPLGGNRRKASRDVM